MLKSKKEPTSKNFIFSVTLAVEKMEERDLTKPKKPGSISLPYCDSLCQDILHKMIKKQSFRTSSDIFCFVGKIIGFEGGQVKEKKALFYHT